MEIETYRGDDERTILTDLITRDDVLAGVAAHWEPQGLFSSWASNVIARLCVEYHEQHKRAPGRDVARLFARWSRGKSDDSVKSVERLLAALTLPDEAGGSNSFSLDAAGDYFNRVRIERLLGDARLHLEEGRTKDAEELIAKFKRVELGAQSCVDLFLDEHAVKSTFDAGELESLVPYDQALYHFFHVPMQRGNFVAFQAPNKVGKCVDEDSEVVLADGRLVTIREIVEHKIRMPVLAFDERAQRLRPVKIAQFWDNGEKECWELTTRSGRKVVTTENHQYMTQDGWKFLSDLTESDFVAAPKMIDAFGDHRLPDAEVDFIAFMLADGGCTGTQATFTKTDPTLCQEFMSCCRSLGITYKKKGIEYRLSRTNDLRRKYACALWQVKGDKKRIPSQIFTCPKDQVARFLRVLFSCDGYVLGTDAMPHIGLTLCNEMMLRQVSHLLLRFGVVHCLKYDPVERKSDGRVFDAWTISVLDGENAKKFFENVGLSSYKSRDPSKIVVSYQSFLDKFPHTVARRFYDDLRRETDHGDVPSKRSVFLKKFGVQKASSLRERIARRKSIMRVGFSHYDESSLVWQTYMNSHVLWDQVVSLRPVGMRRTYDIAVPEHHNFVANDIIVHNSWWLCDVAWRAQLAKKRVLFIAVGDETEPQVKLRFMVRAAEHPWLSTKDDESWPCTVKKPKSIETPADRKGSPEVRWQSLDFDAPLNKEYAWEKVQELTQVKIGSTKSYFKLRVFAGLDITVPKIRAILEDLATRDGWVADVVVIDYIDNLAPVNSKDPRHDQVNMTWKLARALAIQRHCLVVTATQVKAAGFKKKTLDKTDFSEDNRKFNVATGVVSINQELHEKRQGVYRLTWSVLRGRQFDEEKACYVASCLPLGHPSVVSTF